MWQNNHMLPDSLSHDLSPTNVPLCKGFLLIRLKDPAPSTLVFFLNVTDILFFDA